MVKDDKRFADGGGWGYAVFDYNAASDTFTPGTTAGTPPQGNDAKCGFACHTRAKARDYVFTVREALRNEYGYVTRWLSVTVSGSERSPRRAAIVTRSGSESAFILRMT